jgi:hypothetical protein
VGIISRDYGGAVAGGSTGARLSAFAVFAVCDVSLPMFVATDRPCYFWRTCRGGGMADATDLKSVDRKVVRVRLPPSAPKHFNNLQTVIDQV